MDLPEDFWELVFRSLEDERHLHPISLVCRRFVSITDRLRTHLRISDNNAARLFRRFPNLNRISVTNFHGDLDLLFREIARSGLKIEAISLRCSRHRFPKSETARKLGETLRSLDLRESQFIENDDVISIAKSFPNLEFLDISRPQTVDLGRAVTNAAIEVLSSNLKHLRTIRLSGNPLLSDLSILSLSKNCSDLTEITAQDCSFIKTEAISSLLRHNNHISNLSLNAFPSLSTFVIPEALRHLHLSQMHVPEELLSSLEHSSIQIQDFSVSYCWGMTSSSLVSFLSFHGRSLRRLALAGLRFVSDEIMESVLPHLGNLNSISLSALFHLSNSTLFSIIRNCVWVEHVMMRKTSVGKGSSPSTPCMSTRLKSLCLKENPYLDDHTIGAMARSCPNMESLDISSCWELTNEGLESIGERCPKINNLCIKGCSRIKGLGTKLGFISLTSLWASGSGINDEALYEMSQRCKAIMLLDLDGCLDITEKGMNDVLIGCKMLQEIYLGHHELIGIVSSRILLRKIVLQPCKIPSKLKELFLCHGCLIRAGQ